MNNEHHVHNWQYKRNYEYTFMQIYDKSSTFMEKSPLGEWWCCDECGGEQLRFVITEGRDLK